jgi:predicted transposase YdaD
VAIEIDRESIQFLDKEIYTDIGSGDRHEVDLLVRVRLRGSEAFILIHVENQATFQSDFPRRMFQYCARVHEKYGLPVYPIAVLSYDKPMTPAGDLYAVDLFGLEVLRFRYRTVQLNRLSWRDYVRNPNPIASAMMAKMNIATEDRPRVKLECLRMLVTLKLDPAKSELIGVFMNSYLKLTTAEIVVYNREVEQIEPTEREVVMIISNEWTEIGEERGLEKGRVEGRMKMLRRLLRHRFGELPTDAAAEIDRLNSEQADNLAEALLDFQTLADLQAWLRRIA